MQVNLFVTKNSTSPTDLIGLPDQCPYCHRSIEPIFLHGFRNQKKKFLHVSFYCPSQECGMHFIGYYTEDSPNKYGFRNTLLGTIKPKEFSEIIKDISSDFLSIFQQARSAEHYQLNHICGVGYRKALEFLIKDYIISKNSSLRENVEKAMLGNCIKNHIQDDRIKSIASRAVWLGNDETHYVRKWVDKDITDLKSLIDLTVHWIETEALTERMIASMPEQNSNV